MPVLDFKKSQKFKLASWLRALVPEAAGGPDDQKSLSHEHGFIARLRQKTCFTK